MSSFKNQTLKQLESAVAALSKRVEYLEGKENNGDVHYVAGNEEYVTTDLYLDYYRFNCDYRGEGGYCKKKYSYYLLNYSSLTDYLPPKNGQIGLIIHSNTEPEKFKEVSGEDIIQYGNDAYSGNPKIINCKKLDDELGLRYFIVKKFNGFRNKFDKDISPEMNFKENIVIEFKNKYLTLPHVHCYFTPLQKHMIEDFNIIELTNSGCTIEICFGGQSKSSSGPWFEGGTHEMPEDIKLHVCVRGPVEKSEMVDKTTGSNTNTNISNELIKNEVTFDPFI
jgi:hypothetical protein